MKESIKLDGIELPTKIEIEMNSSDFSLNTIGSFVTPNIIESKEDLNKLEKLDEIYYKVSTLENASNEILEGAGTLKNGTNEFSEKKVEFNIAMKQVSKGITSANQNYAQINNGINELNTSSKQLGNGAEQISKGTTAISENLELIAKGTTNAKNGSIELEKGEKELVAGINEILEKMDLGDNTKKIEDLNKLIKQNGDTIIKLTNVNKEYKKQLDVLGNPTTDLDKLKVETLKSQIEANTNMIALLTANKQAGEVHRN